MDERVSCAEPAGRQSRGGVSARPVEANTGSGIWSLMTAGVAALLASSCCLLPLVLVSMGFSGAWLANLRTLQPYSQMLVVVAVGALAFAGRSFVRPAAVCSSKGRTKVYKAAFWVIATLTVVLLLTPAVAPWFY